MTKSSRVEESADFRENRVDIDTMTELRSVKLTGVAGQPALSIPHDARPLGPKRFRNERGVEGHRSFIP